MKVSASVFAADPIGLESQLAAVAPHVDSLHVDIMDGRFAPAFGLDERLIRRLVGDNCIPVDIHLMVDSPEHWARRIAHWARAS